MRIKAMLLAIFSIGMPLVIAAQAGLEVTASDWLGQADCWPGGQRPSGTNLLGRLRAAHETRESVAIAEWAQNSRIPRAEQRRQRFALSMARRESAALGPNRVPIGTSCRLRCWASAQVPLAAQAETPRDLRCARAMVTVRSPRVIIERIGRIQRNLSSLIHAVYRVG